jgi:hypothetical protein
LIHTLDRFLPGPQPLSATAAAILDAAQVKPGSTFGRLSNAEKAKVFETLERLPVESAGSIRFLVGNLQDLTAFLAYSTRAGWRTTQALATPTEKIFVRYFGGDPWVGRESPVSSVDGTVTAAVLAAGL